jgi:alpha-tubulin suppressor-like RCC1 family protein
MSRFMMVSLATVLTILSTAGCREDLTGPSPDESEAAVATATAALTFYQVSSGGALTCGVTLDNRAYCWGGGYLGDGTVRSTTAPVAVAPALRFRQISAASNHTCALTLDYQAYCWGRNNDGSLGDGTTEEVRLTPVPVVGGHKFRQIESGDETTCAVT